MNKEILKFVVPRVKQRAHYVLFADNTPFKPKSVKNKTRYSRKPKHTNRTDW